MIIIMMSIMIIGLTHLTRIALAFPALLLSLSSDPSESESRKFACLACEERNGTPNFFTTYRGACSHKSHSPFCNMSSKGIATVVLPNRPTDNEAGGSGAAGQWSGQQQQRNSGVRALPPGPAETRYEILMICSQHHIECHIIYHSTT